MNLNGKRKPVRKVVSIGSLMPLILPDLPPDKAARLQRSLANDFGQKPGSGHGSVRRPPRTPR